MSGSGCFRDSPAAQLGLASGDVIINVNGWEVNSKAAFTMPRGILGVVEVGGANIRLKFQAVHKNLSQDFGIILAPGA